MQGSEEIFFLAAIYAIAYGLGVLISKFWWWLRIIIFLFLLHSYLGSVDFQEIKLSGFLLLIVPACLFVYPSLKKMLAPKIGTLRTYS